MRPEAQLHGSDDTPNRIIYIGDVRRKKQGRTRQPDMQYLAVLGLIALAAWVVWGVVLFNMVPSRLLSYMAFLTPLTVALTASGSIGAYVIEYRMGYVPALRSCVRRGLLVAAVLVLNLVVLAAHRWALPLLGVSAVLALGVELAMQRRERL